MTTAGTPARLAFLLLSPFALTACSDPIEETWRSTYATEGKHNQFSLDGDLVGEGRFYLLNAAQDGILGCGGDVDAASEAEGSYTLTVAFRGGGECAKQEDAHLFCTLREDDTQLFCGPSVVFEVVDE